MPTTTRIPILILILTTTLSCTHPSRERARSGPSLGLDYPPTRTVEQVDDYHGVPVADPYRWLEGADQPETLDWVAQQDQLLERYVGELEATGSLAERCREIREFGTISPPVRRGTSYFSTRRQPGATHGVLVRQEGLAGDARPVIDFAQAIDEPSHRMGGFAVSPDGRHVTWASMDPKGWGWLDLASTDGRRAPSERIDGVAGNSAIWTHDSAGFFYMSYGTYQLLMAGAEPKPRILYHRLGDDPADDRVLYERPDRPSMLFNPKLSDDGRYLVVALMDGSRSLNQVVYADLEPPAPSFETLIGDADALYLFEGNVGRRFIFQTTLGAPHRRLVAIDLDRPQRHDWQDIVPEREQAISTVSHIGGKLVVQTTVHARPVIEVWSTGGELERTLDLPAIGLVSGFADDPGSPIAFYRMNSLIDPGTIYRVDLESGNSTIHHELRLAHDPADYEIRQVFYESRDGTRVPMFLAHRKGVELRGDNPLFMYGFGHGGWVAFPWFQPHLVAWMEMGGTYALPGLRGGGEYGAEWQQAGTRLNKQNSIDDYIAAAEWLIENGYTSADKLVANGGSASGVVPAAAVIQRPDLFAAAVIDFPFLDMLRYHKFTTVKGWTSGYGSSEDPDEFEVLRSYSPLHRIEPGRCYPAILTLVAEKDTATVPMHGYKFTAAMQAQGCDQPVLLRHIPGAGHYSYGTSSEQAAETEAQILAFLVRALDLET